MGYGSRAAYVAARTSSWSRDRALAAAVRRDRAARRNHPEMQRAAQALVARADLFVMAAAPADYRPTTVRRQASPRQRRSDHPSWKPPPDILGRSAPKKCVGSGSRSRQGGNGLARAQAKLRERI